MLKKKNKKTLQHRVSEPKKKKPTVRGAPKGYRTGKVFLRYNEEVINKKDDLRLR